MDPRSDEFATWRATCDVKRHRTATTRFHHLVAGGGGDHRGRANVNDQDIGRVAGFTWENGDIESGEPPPLERTRCASRGGPVVQIRPCCCSRCIRWATTDPPPPAAVIGASIGAIGPAVGQRSLRAVLGFCNARQMTAPEAYIQFKRDVFLDDGEVTDPATREFLAAYMEEFRDHVVRVLTVLPR